MAQRAVDIVELGSPRRVSSWLVPIAGCAGIAVIFGALFPVVDGATSGKTAQMLPLAVVAASGMLLLAVTRPDWLLVLGFFLLAFVKVEPAPVDLAFLLLILVIAIRSHDDPLLLPPGVLMAVLLFAPITVLSLVNANEWGNGVRFEAITLYLLAFAMFLPTMLQRFGVIVPAIKAYVIVAAFSALAGTLAVKPGFPGSSALLFDSQRAQAFFKDPNVFGPFLVPPLIIVLEDLVRPRLLGWSARLSGLVAIILAVGVLFSYSRAAILNFGLGAATLFGVYLWRRRGRAAAVKLGVAAAVCGLVGFSVLAATNSLTFFESRSHLQSYDKNRFATQGAGFEQASVHLLGHGPGQVGGNLPQATHSTYARVAYEQGYLGLALIIAILVATLVTAVKFAKRDGDISGLGSGALLGAWVGLIANSFFIDTLHWRHLWIVAGLIWFGATMQRLQAQSVEGEPALNWD
jgi:O-antigen ligase